jgi:hypothetical protein
MQTILVLLLGLSVLRAEVQTAGGVAAADVERIIGTLKWEIREEASGKVVAQGDGPVRLKDVTINEIRNASQRQTPKRIRLTSQFAIEMAEFPSLAVKTGFGFDVRRTDIQVFSWEWFDVRDAAHAIKRQESGALNMDMKQVGGYWEVTRTAFTTDVSLRVIRSGIDPPGGPPHWRINISNGSAITWPSLVNGKIMPN